MRLGVGDKCPDFKLKDQNGNWVRIGDLIGKKILVIFFYPRNETSGCIKEVCSFRDMHEVFKDLGCEVIGISSNTTSSHKRFAGHYDLPYTLLSDPFRIVRNKFGVKGNLFGIIPGRQTYVIDKKGIIRGTYNSISDPNGHIEHALETVKDLQKES